MGIWEYANKLEPFVDEEFRLSRDEGSTPLQENMDIANFLKIDKIYLKREDLNPNGSHKDRGLAFQISAHLQKGISDFVISSSGNSAISATNLLKDKKESLHIFVSENIQKEKAKHLITSANIKLYFSKKPLSDAFKFAKKTKNCAFLRGSTDKYGYEGFKTIAFEIQDVDFDSIFIPTSSGTTAKGIYEGMNKKVPFHIIQTTKVNTLVSEFDNDFITEEKSLANSIVDRVGHRKEEIAEIIQQTKGSGWIISNKEILKAQELLEKNNIKTSNESALTIAAIKKANEKGLNITKPLCIFTGRKHE